MSYNCQNKRLVHKLKPDSTSGRGKLSHQFSLKSLGIFFSLALMGTMVGYFVVRESQLRATRKLIQNCEGQENCTGRIDALERLVKAKRSLQSSDLSQAKLYFANLPSAKLQNADLSSANLSSAKLQNADLSSANLSDARLNLTNLTHAKLSYAQLDRVDLSPS